MRAIKKYMKDQILTSDRKILHCPICDGKWSGNAGDYLAVPDDRVFVCPRCGTELELVEERTYTEYV